MLCAEALPWRCHRRLIADHLALVRGAAVTHWLDPDDVRHHACSDAVRVDDDGTLRYDRGTSASLWPEP